MEQTDLFGEPARVEIDNNGVLERVANHILDVVRRNPSLTDGETVGEIERKLLISVWLDDGLRTLIPDVKQRGDITNWLRSKQCVDPETVGRARRYLQSKDLIRLPQKAIVEAERHRERIARSVKG